MASYKSKTTAVISVAILIALFIYLLLPNATSEFGISALRAFHHGIHGSQISTVSGGLTTSPVSTTRPESVSQDDDYLAICAAVKDQGRDLSEWFVHYYWHLGIRHFYIMDDVSDPPLEQYTDDWGIPREAITFHHFTAEERTFPMQLNIYGFCNKWHGYKHTWIAYFDADEYLEMTDESLSVQNFLKEFEDVDDIGALGINWICHNSNGLKTRPSEGCRQAYTTCIWDDLEHNSDNTDNKHVKSIVQTKYFDHFETSHNCLLNSSRVTVGEDRKPFPWAWRQPVTRDRIAHHHYGVKSEEEFLEKQHRSNAMDSPAPQNWFDWINGLPNVTCDSLAGEVP